MENELIASFLQIAAGQSVATANQYLNSTNWNLEEAIQLFFFAGEVSAPSHPPPTHHRNTPEPGPDGVRAPLPARRDTLYGASNFQVQESQTLQPDDVWESGSDGLAAMFRPRYDLMFHGSFDMAKIEASRQNRWLLINLQSIAEFSSHMLNRDTWSNDAVAEAIGMSYIFWQIDIDSTEGKKVCNYYKLSEFPAILVIDPVTGQQMHASTGMVEPIRLLKDLHRFTYNGGPKEILNSAFKKTPHTEPTPDDEKEEVDDEEEEEEEVDDEKEVVSSGKPSYPALPDEPKGERGLLCRLGIRLPDGRRVQRNFLRGDPIQFLWSFCSSQVEEGESRTFHFLQANPGAPKKLFNFFDSLSTFDEAGLSDSMITMIWD